MGEEATAKRWKEKALQEIAMIKPRFVQRCGWQLETVIEEDRVILYVRLQHRHHPARVRVLRLTYGPSFPDERPREAFVDPENPDQEGIEFWIDDGERAFKQNHNPPVICLEGTWGFHHRLHKDRDPSQANINRLLLEIQTCFDRTS